MKRLLFLFLVLLVSLPAFAQDTSVINVVTEEWEDCTSADGSGLYLDLLRKVYKTSEISVKIMPYSRAVDTVVKKRADLTIGAYEDEIEGVIYPRWHFDADNVSALYLKSRFPAFGGEKDLAGRRVIWMNDYGYDEYIQQEMDFSEVNKRENAFQLLLSNRADFFLDASYDIEAALEALGNEKDRFEMKTVRLLNLYMVFADTPKGKKLAELWDMNFEALKKSGELKKLFAEWEFDYIF